MLTIRQTEQPARSSDAWEAFALAVAYWLREPAPGAKAAIACSCAVAPDALAAWEALADDLPGLSLLAVTSRDRLHGDWSATHATRWNGGPRKSSHIDPMLGQLAPGVAMLPCSTAI